MNNLKKLLHPRRASVITLLMCIAFGNIFDSKGQTISNTDLITISGNITCEDPVKGPLQAVHIYNRNRNLGTLSDNEGNFIIQMGKNDTIWFSTVQHIENYYTFNSDDGFEDQTIDIFMYQDTVWLNAVAIYGYLTMEEFKNEILSLNLPEDDISVAMPILDKYANQRATGEGKTILYGPLTATFYKMNRIPRLKKQGYSKNK